MSEAPLVWEATLDGRYECVVRRMGAYEGRFTITNRATGRRVHTETVQLTYGAPFGPDIGDIAFWKERAMEVVDEQEFSEPPFRRE